MFVLKVTTAQLQVKTLPNVELDSSIHFTVESQVPLV